MSRTLTKDIETIPAAEPADIEQLSSKKLDDHLKTALNGDFGRILCIGYILEDDRGSPYAVALPNASADFELPTEGRDLLFVAYLRLAILRWAGLPALRGDRKRLKLCRAWLPGRSLLIIEALRPGFKPENWAPGWRLWIIFMVADPSQLLHPRT
jgi:hypothetical protein